MLAAAPPEEVREGTYCAGRCFLYFWSGGLAGTVLWGKPSEEDAARLMRCWERELTQPQHDSLVDAHRLEGVDAPAFEIAVRHVGGSLDRYRAVVRAQALVRPEGLLGAVVAGFHSVLPRSWPFKVFTEPRAAFEFLGRTDFALLDELDALQAQLSGVAESIQELRAALLPRLRDAELPNIAKALGISPRTLQRRLAEAGSSFQDELAEARVREGERLLRETELSVKAIAADVGCASAGHFTALFKKRTGETPAAFRERSLRQR